MKYGKDITDKICKLIESDSYTDYEICQNVGISNETFIKWRRDKTEFSEAIKKAHQKRLSFFAEEAKKSLLKKIQGYTIQEKKTVYSSQVIEGQAKPKIKEQTITDKHFQPDTGAIIFTLCNQEPENWKNRQTQEITGKEGKDLIPSIQIEIINNASQVRNDSGS